MPRQRCSVERLRIRSSLTLTGDGYTNVGGVLNPSDQSPPHLNIKMKQAMNRRSMAQNEANRCHLRHKRFASPNSLFPHMRDKHGLGAHTPKRNMSFCPQKTTIAKWKGGKKI